MTENTQKKIDEISSDLGLEKDKRAIMEILSTDDPSSRALVLKSGSWNSKEPWFVIDEEGQGHTIISLWLLSSLLDGYRQAQKECFELKLEKSIWQSIPVDFADVWSVAMSEVIKQANPATIGSISRIDTDLLIRDIKKAHPNLFVDLNEITQRNIDD